MILSERAVLHARWTETLFLFILFGKNSPKHLSQRIDKPGKSLLQMFILAAVDGE